MASYTQNFSSGWATLILNVSESGTSATTNSGKISWSLQVKMLAASGSYNNGGANITVTIGGVQRYKGNSFSLQGVGKGSTKTIASGSFTQSHSADGSLSLSCAASFTSGVGLGNASISSKTFTGTTIPRATQPTLSASSVNLGSSVTINTPRASSAFTHKLYYKIGSGSWVSIATGVGTSYSWTVPKSIASSFPNNSSGVIVIAADTYNGSTKIGSKQVNLTVNVPTTAEFMPAVSSLTVSESVSKVTEAFGSRYVQGLSQLNVKATATGSYNSTIKSYSTSVDGVKYNSAEFTSNVINGVGTIPVTVTVTDSRSRTATKTINITLIPYAYPVITSLSYQQCNADGTANNEGTSTKVVISGKVASVDSQNSRTLTLKWKKSSETTYQTRVLSTSDWEFAVETIINGTTSDETYEFVAELADKIKTVEKEITTGTVALSFLAGGNGAKFGGEAEKEGLEIPWPITARGHHSFVHNGNEFTFIPSGYTGGLWLNYRTQGGTNGALSQYTFGNGAGGLANGQFNNILLSAHGVTAQIGSQNSSYVHFSSPVTFYFNNEIMVRESIYPSSNLAKNLGTTSDRWKYVYAKGFSAANGDGFWCADPSGKDTLIMGVSAANNLWIGDAKNLNNTNIYGSNLITFRANVSSTDKKATIIRIFREQDSDARTILRPETNGGAYLGTTSYRWNTAFFTNAITASDLKEKDVIEDFDFKVEDFILGLKPIAYRRKGEGDGGKRIHLGFGAQDVAKTIDDLEIGNLSMVQASITQEEPVEHENDNGEVETVVERVEKPYDGSSIDDSQLSWGLNYNELIAPMVLMIQKQDKEIKELKERIAKLENTVDKTGRIW